VPSLLDRNKEGLLGIFWKCARIGERLSPYVSVCCVLMAVSLPFPWRDADDLGVLVLTAMAGLGEHCVGIVRCRRRQLAFEREFWLWEHLSWAF